MDTRLQRRASRKNAKRSTGPQTIEGKARSSQNARKHGLFVRDTLLPGEDPQEFLQRGYPLAWTAHYILWSDLELPPTS